MALPLMTKLLDMLVNAPRAYTVWWMSVWEESPWHIIIETSLIIFILYVLFFKREYNPRKKGFGARDPEELTAEEVDELVEEWEPEPLVPSNVPGKEVWEDCAVIQRCNGSKEVFLEGHDDPKLNLAANDFLGLGASMESHKAATAALEDYTCGSCGPRGFYGTTRAHTDLEAAIAKFMGTPESIAYSDSVSTVASAVPAFAKRGDLLVVDDGVNHALQVGCVLSRAKCVYFRHNDMEDLERVLRSVTRKHRNAAATQRRFVIVEGVYRNTGDLVNLPEVVDLAARHKVRVLADETLSFGVLGENGRGITEHYGMPVEAVDVIVASLATTLGSVGGFVVGNEEVTDHQRLAGAGYCFSASAPPFTCAVAESALSRMTPDLLNKLQANSISMHEQVAGVSRLRVVSDPESPICMAVLDGAMDTGLDRHVQDAMLTRIVAEALERGVLVTRTRTLARNSRAGPPALKIHVNANLTRAEIRQAVAAVGAAVDAVLGAEAVGAAQSPMTTTTTTTTSTRRRSTRSTTKTRASASMAARRR